MSSRARRAALAERQRRDGGICFPRIDPTYDVREWGLTQISISLMEFRGIARFAPTLLGRSFLASAIVRWRAFDVCWVPYRATQSLLNENKRSDGNRSTRAASRARA